MKKIQSRWLKIFLIGLMLILAWKIIDISYILGWVKSVFTILSPFTFGAVLAFFTFKPSKKTEHFIEKHFPKIKPGLRRSISVIFIYMIFLVIVVIALRFLIPAIYRNIQDLVNNLPQYYATLEKNVKDLELASDMKIVETITGKISEYINFDMIGKFVSIFTNVANSLLNVFIGIILSIYILIERDSLAEICKTLMGFVLKNHKKSTLLLYTGKLVDIFNSYFIGLLIDAVLIASISIIFFYIFGAPYPWLLGLVIAIGNMIPFFGPIVAAVISYIATAVVFGPFSAIWVLVFQLVLGQIDGNFIQPKIIGNSVGISPFWVIFSVTLFGGIWGPVGMIIGVPIIASLRLLYHDYKEDGKIGNALQ